MPRKPQWFQQLPQIVAELSALNVPVIDRAILERLFGLSRRGTINLMARFGGYQLGKTYLIDRQELIEPCPLRFGRVPVDAAGRFAVLADLFAVVVGDSLTNRGVRHRLGFPPRTTCSTALV